MSWSVDYIAGTKLRAYELVQEKFEATKANNPDWELLVGAVRTLISILPEKKNFGVKVVSSGHISSSPSWASGNATVSVAIVAIEE